MAGRRLYGTTFVVYEYLSDCAHLAGNGSSSLKVHKYFCLNLVCFNTDPLHTTPNTMVTPARPAANGFVTWARKVYNPIGFAKGYNFVLWFIFGGAMVGFVLARFMYLDFSKNFCPKGGSEGANGAAPGECYYYLNFDQYKVGILLHLGGVLPAGLLAVFQFIPAIRHRWIIIHRISGYAAILFYIISLVGALMIARHAFGGGLEIQAWIGFVGIGILVCFILAYINIKRLQIEQHRAWMLRGWFYVSMIYLFQTNNGLIYFRLAQSSPHDSSHSSLP